MTKGGSPYRFQASQNEGQEARVWTEVGGLWWGRGDVGTINVTWPFAMLRAMPTQIRIRVWFPLVWRKFVLNRHEVRLIRRHKGLFSVGVRFEHASLRCPEFLLFWTFSPDRVIARLGELGYRTGG